MFSNSAKYALKAVLYLALHSNENKKMMVKDICEPVNVPKAYLGKLLQELAKHDVISSTRGPKGGFYLSEENRNQTLMQVIDVIDGKRRMESCLLSLSDCNENEPCPLHKLVGPMKSRLIENLENMTIEQLSSDLRNKKAFLPI